HRGTPQQRGIADGRCTEGEDQRSVRGEGKSFALIGPPPLHARDSPAVVLFRLLLLLLLRTGFAGTGGKGTADTMSPERGFVVFCPRASRAWACVKSPEVRAAMME